MTLVDQPRPKGVGSQLRTTNVDILLDSLFQLSNGFWIEVSLDLRFASGYNSNVLEYTILSAACQTSAKSRMSGTQRLSWGWSPKPSWTHTFDVRRDAYRPHVRGW